MQRSSARVNGRKELRTQKEQECKDLRVEVCVVQKAKYELRYGLEESQGMFQKEFQRPTEQTKRLATHERLMTAEVALWK